MPKKAPYWCYVEELVNSKRANGKRMSIQEAQDLASKKWSLLTIEEKQHYKELAGREPGGIQYKTPRSKMASDGRPIDEVLRLQEEEKQKPIITMRNVEELLRSVDRRSHIFMGISCNVQCVVNNPNNQGKSFIPIEIGLCSFSLAKGIIEMRNIMVNPGSPPVGYSSNAKELCELYHKICPFSENENAEDNLLLVLDTITSFVLKYQSSTADLVFFCNPDLLIQTEEAIKYLQAKTMSSQKMAFYPADVLLLCLSAMQSGKGIPYFKALEVLTNCEYDYTLEVLCDFHRKLDCKYCAQGDAARTAFKIVSHLCELYAVNMVYGRHTLDECYKQTTSNGEETPTPGNLSVVSDSTVGSNSCSLLGRGRLLSSRSRSARAGFTVTSIGLPRPGVHNAGDQSDAGSMRSDISSSSNWLAVDIPSPAGANLVRGRGRLIKKTSA